MKICFVLGCRSGYANASRKKKQYYYAKKGYYGMSSEAACMKYPEETEVSFFKAPKDKKLRDEWNKVIASSKRKLNNASRVCELHFSPDDIIRTTVSMVKGVKLENPKQITRLRQGAIPLRSCCKLEDSKVTTEGTDASCTMKRSITCKESDKVICKDLNCPIADVKKELIDLRTKLYNTEVDLARAERKICSKNRVITILLKKLRKIGAINTDMERRYKNRFTDAENSAHMNTVKSECVVQTTEQNSSDGKTTVKEAIKEEKDFSFPEGTSITDCHFTFKSFQISELGDSRSCKKQNKKRRISRTLKTLPTKRKGTKLLPSKKEDVERTEFDVNSNDSKNRKDKKTLSDCQNRSYKPYPLKQPCYLCEEAFSGCRKLMAHLRVVHNTNEIPCVICNLQFDSLTSLAHHKADVHNFKPVEKVLCEHCGQFFSKSCLLKHVAAVHSTEANTLATDSAPFQCHLCFLSFKFETSLKLHQNATCTICSEKFGCHKALKQHKLTVHAPNTLCKICGETLPNLRQLHIHTLKHKYTCRFCGSLLHDKGRYVVHMSKHTGEKLEALPCDICGREYYHEMLLAYHKKRKHDPKKENLGKPTCHICGKVYTVKFNLDIHLRTHTGEKPFRCDMCGKHFISKQLLICHSKVHNKPPDKMKEKCKTCDICNNKYSSLMTLRAHKNKVHKVTLRGNETFPCRSCNMNFARKKGLNKHMQNVHNIHLSCEELPQKEAILQELSVTKIDESPMDIASVAPVAVSVVGNHEFESGNGGYVDAPLITMEEDFMHVGQPIVVEVMDVENY